MARLSRSTLMASKASDNDAHLSRFLADMADIPDFFSARPMGEPREFELRSKGKHNKPWTLVHGTADFTVARARLRAWEDRGWIERIYRLLDRNLDCMLEGFIITHAGESVIISVKAGAQQ